MHSSMTLFKLYMLPYGRVVRREVALARIEGEDVVLNVGCGSLPFTAVLVARLTGAKVVAIDIDPEAVEAARRVVSMLGMDESIEVLHADGLGPIPRRYTKALVALHVSPKDVAVRNLISGGPAVVLRMPRGSLSVSYGADAMRLDPKEHVSHLMPTFDRSLLFEA